MYSNEHLNQQNAANIDEGQDLEVGEEEEQLMRKGGFLLLSFSLSVYGWVGDEEKKEVRGGGGGGGEVPCGHIRTVLSASTWWSV